MVDHEKVLRWLTICGKNSDCSECCPYHAENRYDAVKCMSALMCDALELLKEQEPKAIAHKSNWMTGLPVAICPRCGKFAQQFYIVHSDEETHFCPWCGQAVMWR